MDVKRDVLIFLKKDILEDESIRIGEQDELLTTGLIDSVNLIRTVRYLEKKFKIDIPFEDITLENFRSIHSIEYYVRGKLN
ncbi:acyl carrier protein [Algibacter mikhailovii]|uniref:Carrier domain-containing protein n=1 Tax=Algibacter mikhailovii TaxID=425498 RepID=A0A918QX85_9FLAO|nr:acyl carrier protein [Algibacter mikhailovii]GGZ71035.1 hypothetical protein GCM10007028_05300 [Algibacter mikhailovii]